MPSITHAPLMLKKRNNCLHFEFPHLDEGWSVYGHNLSEILILTGQNINPFQSPDSMYFF